MTNNETIHETNEIEKKEIKNYKKRFKRLNKKIHIWFSAL